MVDKSFSMSSFLALRYIEKRGVNFTEKIPYRYPSLPLDEDRILVHDSHDIGKAIENQLATVRRSYSRVGILLSGGMDSAVLASYLPNCDAYTFRFLGGDYQKEELQRAEYYADYYGLNLHYVDIDWNAVITNLRPVMLSKGGPVHSIEPQICHAAKQAMDDGVDLMIIGDGSDYVFGGMDKLLSKEWLFDQFYQRYIYVEPEMVLNEPVSMKYLFERYRNGESIDYLGFLEVVATEESYGSYSNAFFAAGLDYFDPYEKLKMADKLDLNRIRNGESKYLIRELFSLRYPDVPIPEKLPMPRPVDTYFADWKGPVRKEFRNDIQVDQYNGNQKWLIWCLEEFLNLVDEL